MKKKGEVCTFALSTYYKKYSKAVDNLGKANLVEIPPQYKTVFM